MDAQDEYVCENMKKNEYYDGTIAKKYCQKTCGNCKTNNDYFEI